MKIIWGVLAFGLSLPILIFSPFVDAAIAFLLTSQETFPRKLLRCFINLKFH